MRVLLDTVTFIWAVESPESLSRAARAVLQNDAAVIELSSVSISEIAIKHTLGKLDFGRDHLVKGIADLKLSLLPYTEAHAVKLFDLPPHHTDPFDRQIVAQSIAEDVPVVTPDAKFSLYAGLKVLW